MYSINYRDSNPPGFHQTSWAHLPGNKRVRGIMKIPIGIDVPLEPLELALIGANGRGKITAQTRRWRMRPVTDEEYEREQRAKQNAVSFRFVGGAFWIANDEVMNDNEAALMTGAAVRLTKGISPLLGFEVEAMGSYTGEATFNSGERSRSAILGRAQLGGLLRFGDKVVRVARIGVGVQATRYESETMAGAASTDTSYELSAFLTFGGEIGLRLSDNVILGASASAVSNLTSTGESPGFQSIELGVHLTYGWSPSTDDDDSE